MRNYEVFWDKSLQPIKLLSVMAGKCGVDIPNHADHMFRNKYAKISTDLRYLNVDIQSRSTSLNKV